MNKRINLALQGGGSHGAFTWGVLDKLLECDFIEIAMISGTSAGALNGVALVNGIIEAGPESARVELERIWRRISERGRFSPIQRTPFDRASGNWSLDNSPGFYLVDAITRAYSPYQLNPFNFNPVRQIIEECVDFDRLRSDMRIPLFVSATNVETGQIEVFDHKRLNPDIVVAAGCLPLLNQAAEIEGVAYWDGGFAGNPPLFPLYNHSDSEDIVIVQLTPLNRKGTPKLRREIMDRIYEISFNGSLLHELENLMLISKLVENGHAPNSSYRAMRIHMIEDPDTIRSLGASSMLNMEWEFLVYLRDKGREAAARFLEQNADRLGRESSFEFGKILKEKYVLS